MYDPMKELAGTFRSEDDEREVRERLEDAALHDAMKIGAGQVEDMMERIYEDREQASDRCPPRE